MVNISPLPLYEQIKSRLEPAHTGGGQSEGTQDLQCPPEILYALKMIYVLHRK